tara:strand:- start:3961 stop:4515 length:555 start_codon:yes stop_codon:yes gene_type:complete
MKSVNFINVFSNISIKKITSIILSALISLFLTGCGNKPLKTGYIDINQVNREFKVAHDYNEYIKTLEKEGNLKLVTIREEINLMEKNVTVFNSENKKASQELIKRIEKKKKMYFLEEKKIKKNILDSINIYRDKLNLQINTLIYSYALENGFDYVYSPAGSGTFMYADSNLNITNDVVYYLNSK